MTDKQEPQLADLTNAPLPTSKTLRSRKNLFSQFFRFLGLNVGIMRMVMKGHSQ